MLVLGLANFYIASIRETLRAVNVMTARDLARIQKDGAGGSTFCLHPQKYMCNKIQKKYKKLDKWMVICKIKYDVNVFKI